MMQKMTKDILLLMIQTKVHYPEKLHEVHDALPFLPRIKRSESRKAYGKFT